MDEGSQARYLDTLECLEAPHFHIIPFAKHFFFPSGAISASSFTPRLHAHDVSCQVAVSGCSAHKHQVQQGNTEASREKIPPGKGHSSQDCSTSCTAVRAWFLTAIPALFLEALSGSPSAKHPLSELQRAPLGSPHLQHSHFQSCYHRSAQDLSTSQVGELQALSWKLLPGSP